MSTAPTQQGNRLDRRKARTRAALIRAAQTLIAEGRTNVPILEITQAADVGMGSFYNHFETKEQLFDAALESVLDSFGDLLDALTRDIDDPAAVFATSFRLTGRLHRREPEVSRVADIDLAVSMAAGALIGLGQLLHDQPDRDDGAAADHLAEDLLRVFGVPPKQAHRICTLPLPDPDSVRDSGSAA
jgi:AcrR family transcriptional regulator